MKPQPARRNRGKRLLKLQLDRNAEHLLLELSRGKAATTERLAPGVHVERDETGVALRVRIDGLKQNWTTNAFLTPLIA